MAIVANPVLSAMGRKPYSLAVRRRAIKMFRDGASLGDIQEELGIAMSTVSKWAKKAKAPARKKGRPVLEEPDPRTREILTLARQYSYSVVAERFGITKAGVGRLVLWWRKKGYVAPLAFREGEWIEWDGDLYKVLEIYDKHTGKVESADGVIVDNFQWELPSGIKCRPAD